jgi:hypothetical protein
MIVIFILDHFWSHIFECPAKSVSLLHVVRLHAPSEIADLYYVAIFYQYVFRFDVSMYQTLLMQVIYARAYLNEKVKSSILGQEPLLSNQVEQISFRGIFKGQINCGFVLETGIKPTNVLMVQLFLDSYFSYESFFYFAAAQRLLFNFLNSNLNAS